MSLVFRTPTRCGWHRHHLLPNSLQQYPDLRDFTDALSITGFDLGDFGTNGMFLPADETIASTVHLPLHRGSHHTYNAIVIAALDLVRHGVGRLEPRGQIAALRGLQARLRTMLRTSALNGDVCLASRDPFGCSANAASLDLKTDAQFFDALASGRQGGER